MGSVHWTARRGFSMLEIMLVLAIIGLLIAATSAALIPRMMRAQKRATEIEMRTTADALKSYRLDTGAFPDRLAQLVPDYLEKVPKDGWKNPLYYSAPQPGSDDFVLISNGNDGIPATDDDIDWQTVEQDDT